MPRGNIWNDKRGLTTTTTNKNSKLWDLFSTNGSFTLFQWINFWKRALIYKMLIRFLLDAHLYGKQHRPGAKIVQIVLLTSPGTIQSVKPVFQLHCCKIKKNYSSKHVILFLREVLAEKKVNVKSLVSCHICTNGLVVWRTCRASILQKTVHCYLSAMHKLCM